MDDIVWGAEIECEGKPVWLSDDEPVTVKWSHGDWSGIVDGTAAKFFNHDKWLAFKLPADHPHYATMAREAEFGPEIAVNGVRPEWLGDGDECLYKQSGEWLPHATNPDGYIWSQFTHIRLPSTHWAYTPIAKGFKPWAGGDEAPGDWDGGDVLCRDGTMGKGSRWHHYNARDIIGYKPRTETTAVAFKAGDYVVALEDEVDIVAGKVYIMSCDSEFRDDNGDDRMIVARPVRPATPAEIEQHLAERRLETTYSTGPAASREMVSLPMMTEEEARENWRQRRTGLDLPNVGESVVVMLKELGLIKPDPTDIDRFEDFHGGLDNNQRDIAELAIKWARENG